MLVGEKLKKLRKARGLSQEDLANELKVSRQSISK
ncbi:MAG: helix-turn-helix transcriptional regulator [Turicibacter sp.]|nr:helix-turn-helix transcriptional regulator [Turicibacter sp.]